jgi:hypothetical protein
MIEVYYAFLTDIQNDSSGKVQKRLKVTPKTKMSNDVSAFKNISVEDELS